MHHKRWTQRGLTVDSQWLQLGVGVKLVWSWCWEFYNKYITNSFESLLLGLLSMKMKMC